MNLLCSRNHSLGLGAQPVGSAAMCPGSRSCGVLGLQQDAYYGLEWLFMGLRHIQL